jgi:hypothetical protein
MGCESLGREIIKVVIQKNASKQERRSYQGVLPLALRKNAIALGIELIPVNGLRLAFDGIACQGHETHGVNRTERLAGGTGHGTIELGLGHLASSFGIVNVETKNEKCRLPGLKVQASGIDSDSGRRRRVRRAATVSLLTTRLPEG